MRPLQGCTTVIILFMGIFSCRPWAYCADIEKSPEGHPSYAVNRADEDYRYLRDPATPVGQKPSATGSLSSDYSRCHPRALSNVSCLKMDSLTRAPAFTHSPTSRAGYFISVKIDSYPYTPFAKSPLSATAIGQNNPLNCPQKSVVNNNPPRISLRAALPHTAPASSQMQRRLFGYG
jgi:hypothetical protein